MIHSMRFEVEAFVLQALKPEALSEGSTPEQPLFCRESDAWVWAFDFASQLRASLTFVTVLERAPWLLEAPLESRQLLERISEKEKRRFVLLEDELEEAVDVMLRARVPALLYKGLELARRCYPSRETRPS